MNRFASTTPKGADVSVGEKDESGTHTHGAVHRSDGQSNSRTRVRVRIDVSMLLTPLTAGTESLLSCSDLFLRPDLHE